MQGGISRHGGSSSFGFSPAWRWAFASVSLPFSGRRKHACWKQRGKCAEPAGADGLVPRINGTLRLQKPPLAYWMSAMAYDLVRQQHTGRIPSVIWGWLTIGVTFIAGRHIFGARAGLIAAACLFSSYLFFRHNRLAETDSPSAMFATLAIFAWWLAVESRRL